MHTKARCFTLVSGISLALAGVACSDGGGKDGDTEGGIGSATLTLGDSASMSGDGDGDGDGDGASMSGDGDGDGATMTNGDGDGDGDGASGGIKFDVGDGIVGGGGQCEDINLTGEYEPPNVMLVLDVSCSMGSNGGWSDLTSTVNWMISNFDASVRFGARFFPGANDASNCVYNPDVPIGDNQGTQIQNVMNGESPNNGTPIYPGVHTGLEALKLEPNGQRVLIILSDGVAWDTCAPGNNADTAIENEILAGRQNDTITSYIIGLGTGVDQAALNAWANAGGTPQNKPGGIDYLEATDQQSLQMAFNQIISSVISCVIALDPAPGPEVKKIEIEVDGVVYDAPLSTATTCPGTGDGYIFPNYPTRDVVELCNGACDDLKDVQTADITYSCGQG